MSVNALVPTGLARRDEVRVEIPTGTVEGTVLSARSDRPGAAADGGATPLSDGGAGGEAVETEVALPRAPTTDGGEGQVTVAVGRTAADRLLAADSARVVVRSRGRRREYELVSLLRQAGTRFRRVTIAGGPLEGTTLGAADLRESYGVAVLAVRDSGAGDGDWRLAPPGDVQLTAGDELFVVGPTAALESFTEVAA